MKIESVMVRGGDKSIYLYGDKGESVGFAVLGECCSRSFFDQDSLDDVAGLKGDVLVSVEDRIVRSSRDQNGDFTKHHALVITTNKQSITVMWRNESNGYYDGILRMYKNGDRTDILPGVEMRFK